MKTATLLAVAVLFAGPAYGQAPTWSEEQAEVWAVIEQSWEDDVAENGNWPADYAHGAFLSWGGAQLAPRDLETYARWERMNEEVVETFWYEITPLGIVVEGDTAVAMYAALVGEQGENNEREMSTSRIVETLVRDGRRWKFVASASFADEGN